MNGIDVSADTLANIGFIALGAALGLLWLIARGAK